MNYPFAVAQSAPLASGDTRDYRAPAVATGDAFGDHVRLASMEYSIRNVLFQNAANAVTRDELQKSRSRRIALETYAALAEYGMLHILGAWTNRGDVLTDPASTIAGLQAEISGLQDKVATLTTVLTSQQEQSTNVPNDWTLVPGSNMIGDFPPGQPSSSEAAISEMNDMQVDGPEVHIVQEELV